VKGISIVTQGLESSLEVLILIVTSSDVEAIVQFSDRESG